MITPISPMLASARPLNDDEGFVHEIKWDGYRAVAYVEEDRIELLSRRSRSLNPYFPELLPFFESFSHKPLVLDGEIVALGDRGLPVFSELRRTAEREGAVVYIVFDLLICDGQNICARPWQERRTRLEKLIPQTGPIWLSPIFETSRDQLLAAAEELGLEGIVSKKVDAPYLPGVRSDAWRKQRIFRRIDCVVGGLLKREGRVRALLVGQYTKNLKELIYLGRAASGLSAADGEFLLNAYEKLAAAASPFCNFEDDAEVLWMTPHIVVEIQFAELTPAGRLRHPVFIRFRWDKHPSECVYEGGGEGADAGN